MLDSFLLSGGLDVGNFTIPWSVILLLAVVAIGLFVIRAAITLVKVAILVAIGVGVYLLVQFALHNFNF